MYSQFCFHFQKFAEQERSTMHIPRKPGDRIEVDWARDKLYIIDWDTGEAYALVSNHAFVDGNKRIGVLALLMTLGLNGIRLQYTQAELTELGLSAGAGEMKYDEILDWVLRHC